MLGSLDLPAVFGRKFVVFGGPYRSKPDGLLGVKLALEIDAPCEIDLPIRDFSVPNPALAQHALLKAAQLIAQGHPLYFGCMGGRGRTGLILSLLAKAWGIDDPIEYVRENYYPHAVETPEQERFVSEFLIGPEVARVVRKAKLRGLLSFRRVLTRGA